MMLEVKKQELLAIQSLNDQTNIHSLVYIYLAISVLKRIENFVCWLEWVAVIGKVKSIILLLAYSL